MRFTSRSPISNNGVILMLNAALIPTNRFHLVDPKELSEFEEWARWLEALLNNSCQIVFRDGVASIVEQKHLIDRLNGLKIEIYSKEHTPPHFHLKSPGIDASFAIEDCRLLIGNAPSQAIKAITYWHSYSKPKLIEVWNSTRPESCVVGKYFDS